MVQKEKDSSLREGTQIIEKVPELQILSSDNYSKVILDKKKEVISQKVRNMKKNQFKILRPIKEDDGA